MTNKCFGYFFFYTNILDFKTLLLDNSRNLASCRAINLAPRIPFNSRPGSWFPLAAKRCPSQARRRMGDSTIISPKEFLNENLFATNFCLPTGDAPYPRRASPPQARRSWTPFSSRFVRTELRLGAPPRCWLWPRRWTSCRPPSSRLPLLCPSDAWEMPSRNETGMRKRTHEKKIMLGL